MTFGGESPKETWPEFLPGGCRPLKIDLLEELGDGRGGRWINWLLGAGAAVWVLLFLRMADRLLFMLFDLAHRGGLPR